MARGPGSERAGGVQAAPAASPSVRALRWLLGLRLVVISTLFLGVLLIQVNTHLILPLRTFYGLILLSYGLSLVYLTLHARRLSPRLQAAVQLTGDLVVVTGFVYATGGVYSPFSFLYLTVIVVAAAMLRGGGFIFAGLSAIAYGIQANLMFFGLLPLPLDFEGAPMVPAPSRVLYQILIHVVGFILVALLVSYLTESLRKAHSRLEEETERAKQFVALSQHVVHSVGAGILAADLEGRVLHLNPAGASILDIDDVDAHIGKPLETVMPLTGHNWGLIASRARSHSIARLEGTLERSGARLGLSVDPLRDERATLVGFIVNFQDLTELRVLAERERMRDRMAAIGELAARMAHEIKNPLASISGSAQMLTSVGGVDDTGRRLLDIVVDESRRLSGILDGFLVYARPGQSTHGMCHLNKMLRDCLDLLRRSEELGEGHELILEVPDKLVVLGEEHLLRQIFWNLSRNALQAMPGGGTLKIVAERRDSTVVLRWRDTGVGMTEEIRQRAFEPFVTSQPDGTGLGLAVVYSAVQEHGGTVDIESAPGRGTTITVELPNAVGEA
ncbi:MAG TPA: ATP-binding protein [Methylomirabilota bacterium]|nr:ATP-binding protein [Methylomirabilota bacterium]